jgi:hypothetical protein
MPPESPQPQKPKGFFSRRLILGCCLTPVVLISVMLVGAGIWWTLWNWQLKQKLSDEIQQVRAKGEPLTTLELNDYYQPAKGRPDMTKEILAAFDICLNPDLKPLWERLPIVGDPAVFGLPDEVPPSTQSWGQLAEVEAYLGKQEMALATFHEVARRKSTARYPSDYTQGFNVNLDHVQGLRQASRTLSLEFHVHLHRGRPSQAVDSILAQFAMAQTVDGEPSLVSQLVRVAMGSEAVKLIQRGVKEVAWSDEDLIRLQTGIRDFQIASSLKDALIGERALGYTACCNPLLMTDEKSNPSPDEVRAMLSRPPQRVADAGKILEIHRGLIESSEHPLSQSISAGNKMEAELDALLKSPVNRLTYIMTALLVPAIGYAAPTFADTAARRDSADAAIAAELYRRKIGKWPERLEDLVPKYLPYVPNDPFTDTPMRFKVSADGLKVYSLGRDTQDDGGKLSDKTTPGTDVGFEVQLPGKP